MAYKFKDFAQDSLEGGMNLAAYVTPPFTWPVAVPVLGALLGVTVVPVINAVAIGLDRLAEKREVWKRGKVSEAEKSISETFGNIAVKGFPYHGGGVELRFTEACVHNVYESGKTFPEADMHRIDVHHDREQCAKDLLGNLAQGATPYGRGFGCFRDGVEQRFIAVRKKGELASTFYQSARIEKPEDAPEGAIVATHHYYDGVIGHGPVKSESFYAITPVAPETAARLQKLGL